MFDDAGSMDAAGGLDEPRADQTRGRLRGIVTGLCEERGGDGEAGICKARDCCRLVVRPEAVVGAVQEANACGFVGDRTGEPKRRCGLEKHQRRGQRCHSRIRDLPFWDSDANVGTV